MTGLLRTVMTQTVLARRRWEFSWGERKRWAFISWTLMMCWSASVKGVSTEVLHKSINVLHRLWNKTRAAGIWVGEVAPHSWHTKDLNGSLKKWWCFVVGRLSCVGYQSRLFPVCVNSLPHGLCLGYNLPRGLLLKQLGLVGKCVCICVCYKPTVLYLLVTG